MHGCYQKTFSGKTANNPFIPHLKQYYSHSTVFYLFIMKPYDFRTPHTDNITAAPASFLRYTGNRTKRGGAGNFVQRSMAGHIARKRHCPSSDVIA